MEDFVARLLTLRPDWTAWAAIANFALAFLTWRSVKASETQAMTSERQLSIASESYISAIKAEKTKRTPIVRIMVYRDTKFNGKTDTFIILQNLSDDWIHAIDFRIDGWEYGFYPNKKPTPDLLESRRYSEAIQSGEQQIVMKGSKLLTYWDFQNTGEDTLPETFGFEIDFVYRYGHGRIYTVKGTLTGDHTDPYGDIKSNWVTLSTGRFIAEDPEPAPQSPE